MGDIPMKTRYWERLGRTLAAALLAGSLAVGAVALAAPAQTAQPVAAATTAQTYYPQEDFNYGNNKAVIYLDTTGFTADQLATVKQGITNVQNMLNGIFTFTLTNTKSQADIVIAGKDYSDTSDNGEQVGGATFINYNQVINHIAQHPNGTRIFLDDSYKSYATSQYIGKQWSPQLPAKTDPNYQTIFNQYQAYFDKWNKNTLLLATEHEIGHGIGLDHTSTDTYGYSIMNPEAALNKEGDLLMDVTKDATYIRAAQAIYGGQATILGDTEAKQPTQGYHGGDSGNVNPSRDNTTKPGTGVVYVNMATGADLYSDVNFKAGHGKKLPFSSAWQYYAVVYDANGQIVGYNLGGQQFVSTGDVATTKPVSSVKGVFTVHYTANPKWGIAMWNGQLKPLTILPANSRWHVAGAGYLGDENPYFNLGGDQWVAATNGYFARK